MSYKEKIDELSEKNKEVADLKESLKATKLILEDRLKVKNNDYNKLESDKLRLERELAAAKEEVKLLKENLEHSKNDELKKEISELERELNERIEELQLKKAKIKHLEEKLSEKEKCAFTAEVSDAADKRDLELMIKQVEDLKKESDKDIADATQCIDELEETCKNQLKEIDRLREENTALKRTTVEEQGSMREKLTELEALRDQVANHEEEIKVIKSEEETKHAKLEEELKRKFGDIDEAAKKHIDQLKKTHKEQVKEINRLRGENAGLKGTVEEQGNMRERLTELEGLCDKVAASHEEEMDLIRREEVAKQVELEEKWKRKLEQKTQSHLQEMEKTIEGADERYKDRLQAKEKEFQAQLDKFSQENKELKEHLYNREEAYSVLQDSLDRKSTTSLELEKQVEDIMKHSAEKDQKIKEISERLALKETENELFKQDFESERKDRERINGQLINLQAQHEILKQESAEKEKEAAKKEKEAQKKFHNLKQSNSTLEHDLKESRKEVATKGAEIKSLVQKNAQLDKQVKQHIEEIKKIRKKLKESEAGETNRMKEIEEEMQVLTAQVNAYSREVDKQKGLVTQSQEKHKTEVNELNERFAHEIESKQQLDGELARMRQQFDNVSRTNQQLNNELAKMKQQLDSVSKKHETETAELQEKSKQKVQQFQQMFLGANEKLDNERKTQEQLNNELAMMRQQLDDALADKEELLRAYHEDRAKLEEQMEKLKKANIVLKDKVNKQQPSTGNHHGPQLSSHPKLAARQNSNSSAPVPSGPKQVVQRDGDGMLVVPKTEGVAPVLHTDSISVPDDAPQLSKEELARMFNRQGSSDWNQSPQQVENSLIKEEKRKELAMKADDAVLEVERLRESRLNVTRQSSISTKKPPPPSQQTSSKQRTKPKVKKDQAKQQGSDDSESDIEENKLIDNIDEEIQQMAEDVRKGSRGPTTAEVLFDDGDSSLPYDPNLVCPKCGKQYRVGEIQKLRRHMNEFCTGIR